MNGEISKSSKEKQLEGLTALKKTIWITGSSRFHASRRLKNKNFFSITSISFLSFYSIILSVVQASIDFTKSPIIIQLFTIFAIVLSIFILVISLLESSQDYGIKADRLYKNAQKLTELRRKIEHHEYHFLDNYDEIHSCELEKSLKKYTKMYDYLLMECPENHDPEDYDLFKFENPKDFPEYHNDNSKNDFRLFVIRRIFTNYWLYYFCIFLMPLIIFSVLYFAY
jgi:hypothetical protein